MGEEGAGGEDWEGVAAGEATTVDGTTFTSTGRMPEGRGCAFRMNNSNPRALHNAGKESTNHDDSSRPSAARRKGAAP